VPACVSTVSPPHLGSARPPFSQIENGQKVVAYERLEAIAQTIRDLAPPTTPEVGDAAA
jgi:hypothetical protein